MQDLMAGELQFMVADLGTARSYINAGKLRALGVTPEKRTRLLPDMPSISENGIANFDLNAWVGMMGPAGIPKEIVTKIHTELAKILSRPDVQQRMADIGCDVAVSSPEEFGAFIKTANFPLGREDQSGGDTATMSVVRL